MADLSRDRCVIYGDHLTTMYEIDQYPIFMGCVDTPASDDLFSKQSWCIGEIHGVIQLKDLVPLDVLYGQAHSSGLVGKTWLNHHTHFADFISEYKPKSVLEIGGAHGMLSKLYGNHYSIPWTIIEPNPTPVEDCPAEFIEGMFSSKSIPDRPFDTIIHSHVFEHIYDPLSFLESISDSLKIGDQMIFSLPNMEVMLKNFYTNCLNFEHTLFLNEELIDGLLQRSGFDIVEKRTFLDDHSLFYACKKSVNRGISEPAKRYEENKALFQRYLNYHQENITTLNTQIQQTKSSVFLFGAHVFSQSLIYFGLDQSPITGILDNDKTKQGKRLYGSNLMVFDPSVLANRESPVVILRAGAYNDEISADILENINASTIFI